MKRKMTERTVPEKKKVTDEELMKIAERQNADGLEDFQLEDTSLKVESRVPSRTQINKIYTAKAKEAEEKIKQK